MPGDIALPVQHSILAPDLDAGLVTPAQRIAGSVIFSRKIQVDLDLSE